MHRDGSTCVHCGDSGFVIVPMLVASDGGELVPFGGHGYYAAVRCLCRRGEQGTAGIVVMRLDRYEAINPGWRLQLTERDRENRQALEVIRNTKREAA
jgi:hypothetical protein